jgi:cytochrome b pre-mRNA-processing protein 3
VFKTFDQALRVLGVGDLHVGKRIRKMAENYYGRMHSYRPALVNGSADELQLAVARNCFLSETAKPNREVVIAAKALAFKDALARLSDEALLQGQVTQPLVVEPTS